MKKISLDTSLVKPNIIDRPLDYGFYNMDCMDGMKNLPDNFCDLAIVDPPYGEEVSYGGYMKNNNGGVGGKVNYHLSLWSQERPTKDYFDELFRVSKNQIIFGGNYFSEYLPNSRGWIVWDKKRPENVSFADGELAWTSFDVKLSIFHYKWHGMLQEDMKNKEYRIHPTQKPVALYEWLISKYAKENDIILDTHVGSASSLIACHNTNHKYVGFELDETYYKLAKQRLDQETAQMNIFDYIK